MAVIRNLQWGKTKLDFGRFGPLCTKIHLGTFDRIVHTSFETWVTLFALRGIWKRVVFRFEIHDYWLIDVQKVPRRADVLASFWSCGSLLIELTWHSLRELICWNILTVSLVRHTALLVCMHNLQRPESEFLVKAQLAVRYGQTINRNVRMNLT